MLAVTVAGSTPAYVSKSVILNVPPDPSVGVHPGWTTR